MKTLRSWRSVRLTIVREKGEAYDLPPQVLHGAHVAGLVRSIIGDDPREAFLAIYLDTRHRILAIHRVSIGTADSSAVHPREVFGPALQLAASALIVAHNHPSGDPTPSRDDENVTERLTQAGALLGIPLLDHLIIGEARFWSFASREENPNPTNA